jgi:predicted  nucleic acid-binding Zn-ribbon protein
MTDQTPKNKQADKEWADLQRDLDTLGDQLGSLRDHTAALGETVVANLEARYKDVRSRSMSFRNATEAQFEEMRKLAMEQAAQTQSTLTETAMKSAEMAKETTLQAWERAEPLRQGAQEVGKGFARAWSELAASFGKAAEKIQPEPSDKAAPAAGKKGRKPS